MLYINTLFCHDILLYPLKFVNMRKQSGVNTIQSNLHHFYSSQAFQIIFTSNSQLLLSLSTLQKYIPMTNHSISWTQRCEIHLWMNMPFYSCRNIGTTFTGIPWEAISSLQVYQFYLNLPIKSTQSNARNLLNPTHEIY